MALDPNLTAYHSRAFLEIVDELGLEYDLKEGPKALEEAIVKLASVNLEGVTVFSLVREIDTRAFYMDMDVRAARIRVHDPAK